MSSFQPLFLRGVFSGNKNSGLTGILSERFQVGHHYPLGAVISNEEDMAHTLAPPQRVHFLLISGFQQCDCWAWA